MKKITLLICAVLFVLNTNAQITHDIDWKLNTVGDLTINQGDTVRWTWGDGAPHSVTNLVGSTETFDSTVITGMGTVFTHTFNTVGTNPYRCSIHTGSMTGTIEVQILSIEEQEKRAVSVYPNPVSNALTITTPTANIKSITMTSILGKKLLAVTVNNLTHKLDVSHLPNGVYLIQIETDLNKQTYKVIKN